jgi:L-alanine-DL-glutamate epimerase-like enolase superfamily enzyme
MTHDTLLPEPLDLKDGWIDVTTKPGIGWELDDEKIAKYLPADFPK